MFYQLWKIHAYRENEEGEGEGDCLGLMNATKELDVFSSNGFGGLRDNFLSNFQFIRFSTRRGAPETRMY